VSVSPPYLFRVNVWDILLSVFVNFFMQLRLRIVFRSLVRSIWNQVAQSTSLIWFRNSSPVWTFHIFVTVCCCCMSENHVSVTHWSSYCRVCRNANMISQRRHFTSLFQKSIRALFLLQFRGSAHGVLGASYYDKLANGCRQMTLAVSVAREETTDHLSFVISA